MDSHLPAACANNEAYNDQKPSGILMTPWSLRSRLAENLAWRETDLMCSKNGTSLTGRGESERLVAILSCLSLWTGAKRRQESWDELRAGPFGQTDIQALMFIVWKNTNIIYLNHLPKG